MIFAVIIGFALLAIMLYCCVALAGRRDNEIRRYYKDKEHDEEKQ